jgi:hypothetical protein
VLDPVTKQLVDAADYVPPSHAIDAPIIADRIHEGQSIDVGDRVVDLGSRAKRRAFLKETGLVETSDCSRSWLESQSRERERAVERRIDASAEEAVRKLNHQRKWRE